MDISKRQDEIESEMEAQAVKEEQRYVRTLADISSVMKTTQGRNVIWWVLSLCRIYADEFTESEKQMYFSAGQKSIGIQILEMLNHSNPAAYAELQLQKIKEGE